MGWVIVLTINIVAACLNLIANADKPVCVAIGTANAILAVMVAFGLSLHYLDKGRLP